MCSKFYGTPVIMVAIKHTACCADNWLLCLEQKLFHYFCPSSTLSSLLLFLASSDCWWGKWHVFHSLISPSIAIPLTSEFTSSSSSLHVTGACISAKFLVFGVLTSTGLSHYQWKADFLHHAQFCALYSWILFLSFKKTWVTYKNWIPLF